MTQEQLEFLESVFGTPEALEELREECPYDVDTIAYAAICEAIPLLLWLYAEAAFWLETTERYYENGLIVMQTRD